MATEVEKNNARNNLKHAREFTNIENGSALHFIRGWIPEQFRENDDTIEAADDVWALTILHEHFTSKLNEDKSTRSQINLAIKEELKARAQAAIEKLNAIRQDDEADEAVRMNKLVNKTADEVAQKFGL